MGIYSAVNLKCSLLEFRRTLKSVCTHKKLPFRKLLKLLFTCLVLRKFHCTLKVLVYISPICVYNFLLRYSIVKVTAEFFPLVLCLMHAWKGSATAVFTRWLSASIFHKMDTPENIHEYSENGNRDSKTFFQQACSLKIIHQDIKIMQEWYLNLEKATRNGNYIKTSMLPRKPACTFQQVVRLREAPKKNTSSVSLAYWAIVNSRFLLRI